MKKFLIVLCVIGLAIAADEESCSKNTEDCCKEAGDCKNLIRK